jgi:hypothetical protein
LESFDVVLYESELLDLGPEAPFPVLAVGIVHYFELDQVLSQSQVATV